MSTRSFGGFPPSAPTEEENVYEELEKRRGVEQRQWSPGAGAAFLLLRSCSIEGAILDISIYKMILSKAPVWGWRKVRLLRRRRRVRATTTSTLPGPSSSDLTITPQTLYGLHPSRFNQGAKILKQLKLNTNLYRLTLISLQVGLSVAIENQPPSFLQRKPGLHFRGVVQRREPEDLDSKDNLRAGDGQRDLLGPEHGGQLAANQHHHHH